MNARIGLITGLLGIAVASLIAFLASAEVPAANDISSETEAIPAISPAVTEAPDERLPQGVSDVLRLNRAQVGDEVMLNFIQNSGTTYNLSADDIIYLRNEGVSTPILKAMEDQQQNIPAEIASENPAESMQDENIAAAVPTYGVPYPVYVQPIVAPVSVPVPVAAPPEPASTLYVIPYPSHGPSVRGYSGGFARTYGGASTVTTINAGYGGYRSYPVAHRGGRH